MTRRPDRQTNPVQLFFSKSAIFEEEREDFALGRCLEIPLQQRRLFSMFSIATFKDS